MKLRKLISMMAAIAVVATNAATISLPAAFAATDEGTRTFTEDFEGMEITNTADAESQKATIDALIADGWYPVDNNNANTNPDTSGSFFYYATVMGDDSNKFLRINTPRSNPENFKYGLGRLFPGQGLNAKGVWEIDFKFMPYKSSSTKVQFNFSMNTYGVDVDETLAQHNIISAYNDKMYLGYRDYYPLYEGKGVPQGRIDGLTPADIVWYDVKVIVNCDERYYSVEMSRDGKLFARRSPISFDEDETIGFFKMSALGMGTAAAVYVDDITIKPAEKETLIYNEDFEAFENVEAVADGITTGGDEEDVSGHSYFEGFTPWRAHSEIGNNYEFEDDPDLGSKVVRLGGRDTGSGLIYMPALEKLVDDATQSVRGNVKTSFKIKPEDVAEGAKVNAIGEYTQDITDEDSVAFEIAENDGAPAVVKADSEYVELDPEKWYNVDLVFDVMTGNVSTTVTDIDSEEEIASFEKEVVFVKDEKALKGIMFNVPAGSSVLADDIKIEYYTATEPKPVVGRIAAVDRDSNPVTDIENVPTNLWAIQIPFGCTLDSATANKDTITFKDENGNVIDYRAKIEKNSYYIYLLDGMVLEGGTQYQVTVPATVANTAGEELGQEFKFKFTTAGSKPVPVVGKIVAIDKNSNLITDIENVPLDLWAIQIPFGCTLDPDTANADTITFKDENGTVIDYRAVIKNNSYYIYLDEEGLLEEGTEYQITVPETVANAAGDELGQEFKFKFKTEGSADEPAPVVGKVVAVDKDSNPVLDIENVPTNLWAIQIPFGCKLDPTTANKDTITLVSEKGNKIDYRAKIEKNSYYIYIDGEGVLASCTEYQVTIPATVANTAGDQLGQEFKFKFKTADDSIWGLMEISSVNVNEEEVSSPSDITAGSTVNVEVENIGGDIMTGVAVMVFKKDGDIVKLLAKTKEVETDASFDFEVPSDINMEEIDEVSVFLWDGFGSSSPYCENVSITE